MSRRHSTVHDAAALRLHPSGERISHPKHPTGTVVTAKRKRPTLNWAGNLIAGDAGGDGRVTKRKRLGVEESKQVYKDKRAIRRVSFENDWSFLDDAWSSSQLSSDFLKCIHHFSSQHYAASGQLFDCGAQYRKEKKEKRLKMMQIQEQEQTSTSKVGERDDQDEEYSAEEEQPTKGKGKGKTKGAKAKVAQRDMYKAFDGSALLCIGILLQSYISWRLADPERRKPDAWDSDNDDAESKGDGDSTDGDVGGNST